MPNHVQNRLQFKGEKKEIIRLKETIKAEKVHIDFNKIIPMPKGIETEAHSGITGWVEICTGKIDFKPITSQNQNDIHNILEMLKLSNAITTLQKGRGVLDLTDVDFETFIQLLRNTREFGEMNWYEWSIKNWGTKWNAYDQDDNRNGGVDIYFQTAWSAPLPILEKLATMFPTVEITLTWADEDAGSNVGRVSVRGEEVKEEFQPDSRTTEAWEIYFELHPDGRENYELVNGEWQYKEEA